MRQSASSSDVCLRMAGIVSLLVVLFYLGRPVYWMLEDQLAEYRNEDGETGVSFTQDAPVDPAGGASHWAESKPAGAEEGTTGPAAGGAVAATEVAGQGQEGVTAVEEGQGGVPEGAASGEGAVSGEQPQEKPPEEVPKEEVPPKEEGAASTEGATAATEGAAAETVEGAASATEGAASTTQGAVEAQAAGTNEGLARGVRHIIHEDKPLLDVMKLPIWEKPPPGTPLPAKDEFKLRKEMAQFRSRENVVVVTFANHAFLDFVTNFVRHLTELGVDNILIGAMDHKILEALFFEGVPVFDLESGMPEVDAGWGTPLFHKMGREKVTLVNVFLAMGFELFICDTDVTFLRNPLPFVARFPEADILTSSDNLAHTVDDESLEHWDRAMAAFNIGILHFRPTAPTRRFAREWAELLDKDDKVWDQNGFNDILRRRLGPAVEGLDNHLFWAYDHTLKMGILPVSIFCSGHTYFVQRLYDVVGLKPYAFHATFQYAGTEGKRHRFRESGEFFDPPEYYNPPNGLITFVQRIPQHLLTGGQHTVVTHFKLVNYQLKVLRQELAIATILNRTLVLPEMWCRFERMWYPHRGILDGTATKQPFLCPFDQIIELGRMLPGNLAEAEFGPAVDFREYSFLRNPRTPNEVKQSKLQVVLCDRQAADCVAGSPTVPTNGASQAVFMPKDALQHEIAVLKAQDQFRLIEFSSGWESFGGWDDQQMGNKFNKRIRHYVGIWCCVNANPGHIYYDFFAADKPGWLPVPPTGGWQNDHPAWE